MNRNDDIITLEKEDRDKAAELLRDYLEENLELEDEVSGLEAKLAIDFISEHIGRYYYNQGIADSIKAMQDRVDDLYLLVKEE